MIRLLQICTASDFLQFTAPLLRKLAADGLQVHVVSSPGPELEELEGVIGLQTHPIAMARGIDLRADSRSLPQLVQLMRELSPDVVHAHTPKAGLLGMIAATAVGVPARIYQMHGLRYETAHGTRGALLKGIETLSCRLAHQVICVSPSVQVEAVRSRVVPMDKTQVLAQGSARGVDGDEFQPGEWSFEGRALRLRLGISDDAPCIGFAGRLNRDKGLGDLAVCFRSLLKSEPCAHLLLAGEEDTTDPVDLCEWRAHPQVHFLGLLPEMRPFYAAIDVLTLPSHREGLPQVILEASAMEKCTVACRVTGCVDIVIHERTGLLVPAHRPDALARALNRLLQSREERRAYGEFARKEVLRRFAPAPIYDALRSLYNALTPSRI